MIARLAIDLPSIESRHLTRDFLSYRRRVIAALLGLRGIRLIVFDFHGSTSLVYLRIADERDVRTYLGRQFFACNLQMPSHRVLRDAEPRGDLR